MLTTNVYCLAGDWKSKSVKHKEDSYVALYGPGGTVRIHIPHADARALEAIARTLAFALRMNDGTNNATRSSNNSSNS